MLAAGGDRPYLISGADDKLVKIWDYQTKACVQTLDGHTHNIAAVCFHPELPLIVTGRYAAQQPGSTGGHLSQLIWQRIRKAAAAEGAGAVRSKGMLSIGHVCQGGPDLVCRPAMLRLQ